jgi:hypothetical protein
MLLITIFVELRVVAGRSRKRSGIPQAVALRRTALSEHGMASVNQTRPHCVNQMGKTHSKPLVARHGHGMLCVNRPLWSTYSLRNVGRYFSLLLYKQIKLNFTFCCPCIT